MPRAHRPSRIAPAWALLLAILIGATATPAPGRAQPAAPSLEPSGDLESITAWLDYKARAHVRAMPDEARLLYRRGLMAHRSGQTHAAAQLMRGAADLDPSFMEPRWTLACWLLAHEPGQALLQLAGVVELARQDFAAQWTIWANGIYLAIQAWLITLILLALLIVLFHQAELRHLWKERLSGWVSAPTASLWAWVLLLAPFAVGFGLALPAIAFLALLWPSLKVRERTVLLLLTASLAALPIAAPQIGRMAAPMRDGETRLGSLLALETEPYTEARAQSFARRVQSAPDDPYLQFGVAWLAQQAGDLGGAEAAYRKVLTHWAGDARVLNNLANVLVQQNHFREAIRLYKQATQNDPTDATAFFNLSQAYTHQYDFDLAAAALSRATALDFDLLRSYKEQADPDGTLPLVMQWLAPRTLWVGLRGEGAPGDAAALPPAWRDRVEFTGWPFSAAAVLAMILGLAFGRVMHRRLPLMRCSSCDAVVCRRCSERRRCEAVCRACLRAMSAAPSPDFAKILLVREGRRRRRVFDLVLVGFAMLVPAAGLVAYRRVLRPFLLLLIGVLAASVTLGGPLPYAARTRFGVEGANLLPVLIAVLIPVYALSILGFFGQRARRREQERIARRPSRPSRARRAGARLRDPEPQTDREVA